MSNDKILNEIGELFGRYREADGKYSFFQNKMVKNDIQGISFDDWLKAYTKEDKQRQPPKKENDPFFSSILAKNFYSDRFYAWQKKVIERLQNIKNDIYVIAPPGGGKTTPLMAHYVVDLFMGGKNGDMRGLEYEKVLDPAQNNDSVIEKWSNIFHGLITGKYLNGSPVPRCLFITPIRVLSFEQAEGFQEYFIDLFLFLKSIMMKTSPINSGENFISYMGRLKNGTSSADRIIGRVFGSAGEERFKRINLPPEQFNGYVKQFTENMICVKTGGGSGEFNKQPENAIVSIATYGSAKAFISKISNLVKFIVFDEAHLYQPSEYGQNSDRSQEGEVVAATDAYTIINAMAKQDAQIAFLSGTIHPESAKNFCDYLNSRYGRRMDVVTTEKGDPKAGNQTELHVIADDAIRSEKEQVDRVVNWIQNNEKGKAIILFSKKKINALVDEVIKRLSNKDIRKEFNVNQSDRYRREKIDRFRRSLAYVNPDATQKEIEDEVDKFIAREFPTQQIDDINRIKSKPGAMMISNKKLRTAVSYGIGYIYRQDDIEPNDSNVPVGEKIEPINEKDKLIVADLFSQGKINVLIATAAIGVGVNVNIRDMYLPSCMKFEKNKNNEGKIDLNNKREMSQLINRTGRGRTPISGIYTPREFVPFMQSIVMSGIEDFNKVPAISIRSTDNLKDILVNLSIAASSSKMGRAFSTARTASNIISQKLHQFSGYMKSKYQDLMDAKQIHDLHLQVDKSKQAKHEAELNRHRSDTERLFQYTKTQDRIAELERKLSLHESAIKIIESIISNKEKELLNGKQKTPAERKQLENEIIDWKSTLNNDQLLQSILVVDEYNAILKELDNIHKTTSDTDSRGTRSSTYNRDILTKKLDAIRKKYNPALLAARNNAMMEINSQIRKQNKILEDMENLYTKISNVSNVDKDAKTELSKKIARLRSDIKDAINKANNIQYFDGQPNQQFGGLRY